MSVLSYTRARIRRIRVRLTLRQSTVEFSTGLVPERLALAQPVHVSHPDWDPLDNPHTLYARFRVRKRPVEQKRPVIEAAGAALKRAVS